MTKRWWSQPLSMMGGIGAAGAALVASCLLAGSALLAETASRRIPSLFSDEWVVTTTLLSRPMLEAVVSGHNGAPSFVQNLLWYLDLALLDYRGIIPEIAENVLLFGGLIVILTAIRSAGLRGRSTTLLAAIFLAMWFSSVNHAQYAHYTWRGVEAAGVLLCIGLVLNFVVLAQRARRAGQPRREWLGVLFALLAGWSALYFHAGFAVLPLGAILLAASTGRASIRLAVASVTLLFAWHFAEVHYLTAGPRGGDAGILWERLLGLLVLPASLPYKLLAQIVGQDLAAAGAGAITLLAAGRLAVLAVRLRGGATSPLDAIELVLLAYPLAIAAIVVVVRVDAAGGWEAVLAYRYTSYSVYVVLALGVAGLRVAGRRGRASLGLAVAVGTMAWLDGVAHFRDTWRHQERQQAYMVPYTLDPWALAVRPVTTAVRSRHAAGYRTRLRDEGLNVFSSREYRTYARMTGETIRYEELPACEVEWHSRHSEELDGRRLVELRGKVDRTSGHAAGVALFVDDAGAARGWGPYFPHLVSKSIYRGYSWADAGGGLRAVIVDDGGRGVCASGALAL